MKLYDEDGNEVTAFTKEEVDTKIADATKQAEESNTALEEKTKEFDKLSKLHEDKSTSYTELMKKNKEYEGADKDRQETLESDYKKSIDEQVKKIAGEDKEYAKEIKKQLEREGIKEVTGDADKIAKQIKEATVLTNSELAREPNANPVDGSGGAPVDNPSGQNYTETTEGKATYDALSDMMGLPPETNEEK